MTAAVHLPRLDDAGLIRQVATGDPGALGELYDRYHQPVYRLAQRVCRDLGSTESAVQETFLSIWHTPTYDPRRGEAGAWIMTIARNRALDTVRTTRRHSKRRAAADLLDDVRAGDDTPAIVIAGEQLDDVRRRLEELPAAQREVIELAYFGGLTTTAIAQQLKLPLGTVKSRARLALKKLRESYAAEPAGLRELPPRECSTALDDVVPT